MAGVCSDARWTEAAGQGRWHVTASPGKVASAAVLCGMESGGGQHEM